MFKTLLSLTLIALMFLIVYWVITIFAPGFGFPRTVALSIILGSVTGFYIYTIIDNNFLD